LKISEIINFSGVHDIIERDDAKSTNKNLALLAIIQKSKSITKEIKKILF